MDLKIDALPEKNRLDVGLVLDGPANGLVTKLAGLTAPVSLRIDGKGDWKQWDGRLLADLDSSPFARLALSARDGRFAIKGPTWIARLVTGPTAALLGPITTIDLQSGWANRRAEVSGSVGSDAFKLVTNGKLDLSRNRFEDLHLAFALLKQSVLAPNIGGRDLRADATLNGAFMTPTAEYVLTATTLAFRGSPRAEGRRSTRTIPRSLSRPPRAPSPGSTVLPGEGLPMSVSTAILRSTGRASCRTISASAPTGSMPS
jgi:translocation and assembly module TamB